MSLRYAQSLRSVAVLLLLNLSVCQLASAQTPIDPLRRPDEGSGQFEATLTLSYVPSDWSGVSVDSAGTPYVFARYSKGFTAVPGIRYGLTDKLLINLSYDLRYSNVVEKRFYDEDERIVITRHVEGEGELGFDYKLNPDSLRDPTLSLAFNRETTAANISFAQLTDPIVLSESIGLLLDRATGSRTLLFTFGSGFVANSRVDLGASLSHQVSLDLSAPSRTTLSLLVTLLPHAKPDCAITLQSSFSVEERDVKVGFSMILSKRSQV